MTINTPEDQKQCDEIILAIRGEYGLHRTLVVDIINRRSYANV